MRGRTWRMRLPARHETTGAAWHLMASHYGSAKVTKETILAWSTAGAMTMGAA